MLTPPPIKLSMKSAYANNEIQHGEAKPFVPNQQNAKICKCAAKRWAWKLAWQLWILTTQQYREVMYTYTCMYMRERESMKARSQRLMNTWSCEYLHASWLVSSQRVRRRGEKQCFHRSKPPQWHMMSLEGTRKMNRLCQDYIRSPRRGPICDSIQMPGLDGPRLRPRECIIPRR